MGDAHKFIVQRMAGACVFPGLSLQSEEKVSTPTVPWAVPLAFNRFPGQWVTKPVFGRQPMLSIFLFNVWELNLFYYAIYLRF